MQKLIIFLTAIKFKYYCGLISLVRQAHSQHTLKCTSYIIFYHCVVLKSWEWAWEQGMYGLTVHGCWDMISLIAGY